MKGRWATGNARPALFAGPGDRLVFPAGGQVQMETVPVDDRSGPLVKTAVNHTHSRPLMTMLAAALKADADALVARAMPRRRCRTAVSLFAGLIWAGAQHPDRDRGARGAPPDGARPRRGRAVGEEDPLHRRCRRERDLRRLIRPCRPDLGIALDAYLNVL